MDRKREITQQSKQRATVRFSEEEYVRISSDSITSGESIPVLLKEAFFKGPRLIPLMPAEDQRATMVELRRIGNNINQIARHFNAGLRNIGIREFSEIRDAIAALRRFIAGFNGSSNN